MTLDAPDPEPAPQALWRKASRANVLEGECSRSDAGSPLVHRGGARGWPNFEIWSEAMLDDKIGDLTLDEYTLNKDILAQEVPFRKYISRQFGGRGTTRTLASRNFGAGCRLREFYAAPDGTENMLDQVDHDGLPNLRWLFVGPKGAFNRMHVDVANTASWNALMFGRKHWLLLSPNWPHCQDVWSITQEPGDILFIPSGCAHEVVFAEDSASLSENYVDTHNHRLVAAELERSGHHGLSQLVTRLAARLAY